MAAEAFNRSSSPDDTKAKMYLNKVRERAFGSADNNITTTGTNLTAIIYKERRVELVGEGHHFFDLIRTGRGVNIPGFTTGKHEVFPIPLEEIQFSQGNWSQNQNY
jgi:hypothetical protein